MKTLAIILSLLCFAPTPNTSQKTSLRRILPQGITLVYEPIVLKSGESLVGHPNGSTLQLANGANCPVIVIGDTNPDPTIITRNVHVSSFKIVGNRENQQWEGWGGDPEIKKHSIRNNGICVRFAKSVVINNMDISGMRSGGIVTERKCSDIYILNSKLHDNHFDGAAFYETTNTFVGNCEMSGNEYAGVSIDLGVEGLYMANLNVSDNRREGFFMRNCSSIIVNRAFVQGNGGYGIFLANSELGPAVNNVFANFIFAEGNGGFIKVNDPESSGNILANPSYIGDRFVSLEK